MARPDGQDHRTEAAESRAVNRKLRAAFLAGAERKSLKERGRGLTEDELRRIMRRYPGDVDRE